MPELIAAAYSFAELRAAGCSASALRDAGCTAANLRAVAFPLPALIAAGYSACDLLQAAYAPLQLLQAQVAMADIMDALPQALYVHHAGYCYRCVCALASPTACVMRITHCRALQDGWPPVSWAIGDEGHECGASARTQLDAWSPLPPGFEVAPDGADTRHVCRAHAWSTQALVLANGDAVWTGYWGRHATSKAGVALQHSAALNRLTVTSLDSTTSPNKALLPYVMPMYRQQLRCRHGALAAATQRQLLWRHGVQRDGHAHGQQRRACGRAHQSPAAMKPLETCVCKHWEQSVANCL